MRNDSPLPKRTLTHKQEACLAPAANRIVSAGAGSGKTLVLVEKIGRLLIGTGAPGSAVETEDFLALTFTRKAAGEMRGKVYQDLLERIKKPASYAEQTRLERVRERFQTAKITTIHGFASSLIRSNPVTLGIDPDFQLLEDAAGAEAVRDAVNRVLRNHWKSKDPKLIELMALWEPYRLRKVVEALLRRPIEFRELCDCCDVEELLALVDHVRKTRWAEIMAMSQEDEGWSAQLDVAHDHCLGVLRKTGNSRKQQEDREKAQRLIDQFVEPLREFLSIAAPENFDLVALKTLRRQVKEIGSFRWNGPTALKIVDGIAEAVGPWLGSMEREQKALEWTRNLLDLAEEAYTRLDREKRVLGRLFHDDLLILSRDLCNQEPDRSRGPIRHLLVDEFQDTDPTQWDMILSLARGNGNTPQNLFLVGDVKQAIYGFRGADHTVFRSAREFLSEISGETNIEVVLDDNFRSLTEPLHFTNELFSRMFPTVEGESDPYSVPAQPLVSKREGDDPSSVVFLICDYANEDPWIAEARGVVDYLRRIYSGQDPRYARISAMMKEGTRTVGILFRTYAPMAHYIGELSRSGLPFSVYHGRTFFETIEVQTLMSLLSWMADPGDDSALAAVLRSPLCAWTDEDLAAVADPGRKVRLPGETLLQKGCPPDPLPKTLEILVGSANADGASRSRQLSNISSVLGGGVRGGTLVSDVESDQVLLPSGASLTRTWTRLQRIRRLAGHLSLSETLRLALDGTTGTIALRGAVRGLQTSANIEKFLQLVRDLEESRHSSPQVVVQALRELEEEGPGVAEAEPPTSERSAIQLMTIHAAKGLEFPLVIPACTGKSSGGATVPFAQRVTLADGAKPGGLRRMTLCGIDFPDPAADYDPTPTMLKTFVKEHYAQQTESEEKRLLYVALTRACDHLLVPLCVAEEKIRAPRGSSARFMLDAAPQIEQAILSGDAGLDFGEGTCEFRYFEGVWAETVQPGISVDDQIRAINNFTFDPPVHENQTQELPYRRRIRVTVTDLMTFRKCPRLFYFERFFRAPDASAYFGDGSVPDREPLQEGAGRVVGSIMHHMLQLHERGLIEWKPGTPWPDEILDALDRTVRGYCRSVGTLPEIRGIVEVDKDPLSLPSPARGEGLPAPSLDGRGKGRMTSDAALLEATVLGHLENLARSGILAESPDRERGVLREIPFELDYGEFVVAGAIDRLEQMADTTWRLGKNSNHTGTWRLLDYKTTSLEGRTKEEVVRDECYDLQLILYASAAARILGEPVSCAAVVFTADPVNPLFPIETDAQADAAGLDDLLREVRTALDAGLNGFAPTRRTCHACPYEEFDLCRT